MPITNCVLANVVVCCLSAHLPAEDLGQMIGDARALREKYLRDPHRPGYHFVAPEGVNGVFDPNGAVCWNGRYHLCYICFPPPSTKYHWGHASSIDLVHWRHHPMALAPSPDGPETAIASGGCFVNKQGEVTVLYNGVGAGGCLAFSSDRNLDVWKKDPNNPINVVWSAPDSNYLDPTAWLEGDTYYALIDRHIPSRRRHELVLYKADRLDDWKHVGRFMARDVPGVGVDGVGVDGVGVDGVGVDEDFNCPSFFKLGDKHMLLCISHNRGCRYYLGQWKNERFTPASHGRMSWVDNSFLSPITLKDARGRRIMWAWITDLPGIGARRHTGFSGTMSLPRVLSLDENGMLRIRPVEELNALRYNGKEKAGIVVDADSELPMNDICGNSVELAVEMVPNGAEQFGVKVCRSPDGEEQTVVYYDATDQKLKIDTRKSSLVEGAKSIEAGPLELKPDEPLRLRVFVDKSVVEVFANDGRQAVTRRIYPSRKDSIEIRLFATGGAVKVPTFRAWDMMPSNPF